MVLAATIKALKVAKDTNSNIIKIYDSHISYYSTITPTVKVQWPKDKSQQKLGFKTKVKRALSIHIFILHAQ